jgi:hypothetical protein
MPVKNDEDAFWKGDEVYFTKTTAIKDVKGTVKVIKGRSGAVRAQEDNVRKQINYVQSGGDYTVDDEEIIILQDSTVKLAKT